MFSAELDEDADEDDSEDDEPVREIQQRKKRKSRRPRHDKEGNDSVQSTPRASRFASFIRDHPRSGSNNRPAPARRATFDDLPTSGRAGGVSEDEGRDRIRNALRKGLEGARGLSYVARKTADGENTDGKRPGNLRRITGLGGLDQTNSPHRPRPDRNNNSSVQKWRQVKAGLRMLGQRKKDERMQVDHQKSAQLMAELLAGAPAALIFASMFQRDEHHHRKVPVLLEQLNISIPDVQSRTDKKGDRDYIYVIDLEYGNGPSRMKWTVHRSVNDFVNLHLKYKAQGATDKVRHLRGDDKSKAKIPRFPKSVIPFARGVRGLFEKVEDEEDEQDADGAATDGETTPGPATTSNNNSIRNGPERPKGHKRRKSSFAPVSRMNTGDLTGADAEDLTARQKQQYAERSRQKLETYLQQMIRWLIFRADSTRLCKFLEISAMAIRLSAEGGYQGKQGLLQIASRRHRELRRKTFESLGVKAFKERHKRRWFLVRHSYIVCVDGPESLHPYDVFLVDSDFAVEKRNHRMIDQEADGKLAKDSADTGAQPKKAHLIRLYNSERSLKLYARNEKQYNQFVDSLKFMMSNTIWAQKQRFGSYAPVRNNVWARWLVDGRDFMWQVSRAIDNAKDFIYIHDWWLSPELYMRRPAAISQKWRLDRLLQRKAQQGVKIFVIIYRNIESAIPIDSEYTKWSLLDLHENICIQRSPNQFRQNQFFWAHHEKLVVVDNMMAFVGGIDLCFGRWDDPCHSLTDDKLTGFEADHDNPRDAEHCQVWPGKDYSNPRVQDFYALDRPYEEMYDRTKVPRMPWHDISMQMVGQSARDVGRHFVQRWNYVLRSRVPSRPTPVLMPPPEFEQEELDRLGMTGTCQVQVLRSCSPWSIGTPNKVEHSIMNAYCALIEGSDHFVYIENQFYVSSCTVEGTTIHNKIGDAIVNRAIQAHRNREAWQACLIIPLMPGFQNSVDSQDGTSVRLIMQCQYRSICRGDTSIFGRLRAQGIEPEDYVRFYSLRQWGKIGPRKSLTTEQLYIHAKCMIVDDRHAIIGSANINERSMLGSRDSEVATIVTDTRMIPSFMGGRPYDVGEFPHTLRKRLMREHLGIDVDAIYRREQGAAEREEQDAEMSRIYETDRFEPSREYFETPPTTPPAHESHSSFAGPSTLKPQSGANANDAVWSEEDQLEEISHENRLDYQRDLDVAGYGIDNMKLVVDHGEDAYRDSYIDQRGREVLLRQDAPEVDRIKMLEKKEAAQVDMAARKSELPAQPPWPLGRLDTYHLGLPNRSQLPELPPLDDTDIGGPTLTRGMSQASKKVMNPLITSLRRPDVHEDCMTDPIVDGFYQDVWHKVAENNTKLFRQVFRCQPDSEVLDWRTYHKFNEYNERFMQAQGLGASQQGVNKDAPAQSGPPGFAEAVAKSAAINAQKALDKSSKLRPESKNSEGAPTTGEELNEKDGLNPGMPGSPETRASSVRTALPSPYQGPVDDRDREKQEEQLDEKAALRGDGTIGRGRTVQYTDTNLSSHEAQASAQTANSSTLHPSASQKRRRRANTKGSMKGVPEEVLGRDEAEELLKLTQGSLVLWPYDW
jgi:phospholipase D1/2